jgi:hypothetical protein
MECREGGGLVSTAGESTPTRREFLSLPADLERRLYAFRGQVWFVKLVEAICGAVVGVLLGYLVLFVLDRLTETPAVLRYLLFAVAVSACALVPLAFHRWIWKHRGLDQVARLVGRRFPGIGDQLLGIIELVRGPGTADTNRSRALCEAAIEQVAARALKFDFAAAVPRPRHRGWLLAATACAGVAGALAWIAPEAATNAWVRLVAPWRSAARYTFARVAPLPEFVVIPHGEPAEVVVELESTTTWRPPGATARIGGQKPLLADLKDGRYEFALPPQLTPAPLALAVGDVRQRVQVEPMLRPEINVLVAEITLPAYLGRDGFERQEIRGGTLAAVVGSTVALVATADRELATATFNGIALEPEAAVIRTPPVAVEEKATLALAWKDTHGLTGSQPLELAIVPRVDERPGVVALDLPPNRDILLNTDTLRFRVAARDDYGLRRVGLEWEGMSDWTAGGDDPAAVTRGERLLQAGGPTVETLEAVATFCPDALGISPQPILLKAFAEDYAPGHGRSSSPPVLIYVLDRAEHALVLNTRLQYFRQQASEVRDREMSLLATNKDLRGLPAERLLDDDVRGRLQSQALAEEANARRLERLVDDGGKLVREAMKNPDFEATTLEQLAEDIQALADIAANRMPGVAEMLAQAATAERVTAAGNGQPGSGQPGSESSAGQQQSPGEQASANQTGDGKDQAPQVGENRGQPGGGTSESEPPGDSGQPQVPQVVDQESSQQPATETEEDSSPSPGGPGRLGLPSTQAGVSPPQPNGESNETEDDLPADEALDAAIAKQEELLAQFALVADELAAVMARLEGSTFVKRFKLASREQSSIGSRLAGMAVEAFAAPIGRPDGVREALAGVKEVNNREAEKISALLDDLQAYFDRRQLPAFQTVLEEMKQLDALGSLRQLSERIPTEAGMSIAQTEFWSDTFDRLADDLVPLPQGGSGSGAGSPRESVPPEVVLELMKILEEEMNLREETRVVEQTKDIVGDDPYAEAALTLADRQEGLADRMVGLVDRLLEEPEGEREFSQEIRLFDQVEEVMVEVVDILATPETGPKALGAESEAIELLLAAQAAAANRGAGGGGGGGTTPGGGGTGSATTSALALVGSGNRTVAETGGEGEQSVGVSGRVLPEEFRAGLDAYFNRLERQRP